MGRTAQYVKKPAGCGRQGGQVRWCAQEDIVAQRDLVRDLAKQALAAVALLAMCCAGIGLCVLWILATRGHL